MKAIKIKRSRFRLRAFLTDLHRFSVRHLGDGAPLPGVSGDITYFDAIDLAEALASDDEEAVGEIPDDSLKRLEMGLSLFGQFAIFNGDSAFACINGQEVEVPCLDEDEEDEEPRLPRRRRTKKYREAVENTVADDCSCFGFVISLVGDKVEIEAMSMRDGDGDCELEAMLEPNLLSDAMRKWVRSFFIPKSGGKS